MCWKQNSVTNLTNLSNNFDTVKLNWSNIWDIQDKRFYRSQTEFTLSAFTGIKYLSKYTHCSKGHLIYIAFRACSHPEKAKEKANIFLDICCLFSDCFYCSFWSFSLLLPLSLGVNRCLENLNHYDSDKKVLLLKRKRHTARRVAALSPDLPTGEGVPNPVSIGGGTHIQSWGGVGIVPHQVLIGGGAPSSPNGGGGTPSSPERGHWWMGVPPSSGRMGVPPIWDLAGVSPVRTGWGYSPVLTWDGVTPPPSGTGTWPEYPPVWDSPSLSQVIRPENSHSRNSHSTFFKINAIAERITQLRITFSWRYWPQCGPMLLPRSISVSSLFHLAYRGVVRLFVMVDVTMSWRWIVMYSQEFFTNTQNWQWWQYWHHRQVLLGISLNCLLFQHQFNRTWPHVLLHFLLKSLADLRGVSDTNALRV